MQSLSQVFQAIYQEQIEDEEDVEQLAALEAEFEDDAADLESGRKNKNLKRTWQRVWRGKQ